MTTFDDLIFTAAATFGMPREEIQALAACLASRPSEGFASLELRSMTASALTDLLLAVMSRSSPSEAAMTVAGLREATAEPLADKDGAAARSIPLFVNRHTLGEALDSILLSYSAEEELVEHDDDLLAVNITLTVYSPSTLAYSAELRLSKEGVVSTLRYHRNHWAFDDAPEATWSEVTQGLIVGGGDLTFAATVSSATLFELAEVLERLASKESDRRLSDLLGGKA